MRDKNGFEVYRLMAQKIEGKPTNAAFHMERMFPRMAKHCTNLPELKLRMDRIISAEETYHQRTGERMADKTMKMVLFNCLDDETMKLAFPEQFDEKTKTFDDLVQFIKQKYNTTHNTIKYNGKPDQDDPMGVFSMFENTSFPETGTQPENEIPAKTQEYDYDWHLDPLGRNKGKGKGRGDSKCNKCGGGGHFAAYCPSPQSDNRNAGSNIDCWGCNGKGHRSNVCPTKNPDLKGEKGKGKDNKGKGKGKGQSGGKGKGGTRPAYSFEGGIDYGNGFYDQWGVWQQPQAQWAAQQPQWPAQPPAQNGAKPCSSMIRMVSALGYSLPNQYDVLIDEPATSAIPLSAYVKTRGRKIQRTMRLNKCEERGEASNSVALDDDDRLKTQHSNAATQRLSDADGLGNTGLIIQHIESATRLQLVTATVPKTSISSSTTDK